MAAQVLYPKQFWPEPPPVPVEIDLDPPLAMVLPSLPKLLDKTLRRVESGDPVQLRTAAMELRCIVNYLTGQGV